MKNGENKNKRLGEENEQSLRDLLDNITPYNYECVSGRRGQKEWGIKIYEEITAKDFLQQ